MGQIHALFVGVNEYPAEIATKLEGCVNDITEAHRLIEERSASMALTLSLIDGEATIAAVTDAIDSFLGQAGPGDTALLWFAGHGTESPASGADLLVEATGWNQALMCVDGALLDKRLGAMLERIAAGGAETVAVLDCCFSGGATRERDLAPGMRTRYAPPPGGAVPGPRHARDAGFEASGQRHLLLAASRLDQKSHEDLIDGRVHGAFTHALLWAVRAAGPAVTYRQLLAAAEARVRSRGVRQQPVLFPGEAGGPADRLFLSGSVTGSVSDHLLRHGPQGWEVDCGTAHGLRAGEGADGTEFLPVPLDPGNGPEPSGPLRARSVWVERTLVEPVGWSPDQNRVYPVAVSALAVPPATVSIHADADTAELLEQTVASNRPGGRPDAWLHAVERPQDWAGLHFRAVAREGFVELLGRDGAPFVDPLPLRDESDARRVADCLVHLTRWHRLRDLESGPSSLDNAVRLDIVPWGEDEALLPDGSGEIVCSYHPVEQPGPREPLVSIRLHNRSRSRLWCVLLDMTDSYASDPGLFPGHFIGPGSEGHALRGDLVALRLPPHRPEEPGAEVRDWLKLIVAEAELNTVPFCMERWDPTRPTSREGMTDEWPGVLRLGPPRGHRDAGVATERPYAVRWATRTVRLRTVVPGAHQALTGQGA